MSPSARPSLRALTIAAAIAAVATTLWTPAAAHNSEQFAKLSGTRVVGAKGDADGRGRATIRSAAEIETLCYDLRFSNVPPATSAHIHQGVPGQNGPIVVTLFDSPRRSRAKKCISNVDESLLESMQASPQGYYLDVHTRKHPGGALRGPLRNLKDSGLFQTCTRYRPDSERARKAGTIIVTDGSTQEEPVTLRIEAPAGTPAEPADVLLNVQLTTRGVEMGLYARYEFTAADDYDLVVLRGDGSEAARADGFNPTAVGPNSEPNGTGGHSEQGAEQIDGLSSQHCDGYTLSLVSKSGAGGEASLKLWTGESQYAPE